jgi:hypothetical protein
VRRRKKNVHMKNFRVAQIVLVPKGSVDSLKAAAEKAAK